MIYKLHDMQIISSCLIAKDTIEMVLFNHYVSENAEPGQFLYIRLENKTLRRPLSIADVDKDKGTITLLFKMVGNGTEQLGAMHENTKVHVHGPVGQGFPLKPAEHKHVLIVGGGIGVPPLYYLAKQLLARDVRLTSVLGFQAKEYVFYEDQFSALSDTHIVTDDGSYGYHGVVTDVTDKIADVDAYYACGPLPMLKAIQSRHSDISGYLSLEERMGCGVGACLACVVETRDGGYRKICKDGPVFSAEEVLL